MRKLIGALALVVCCGCATNPPTATDPTRNLSAAGHAAYDATKVVKALDVLRDVAAEGEKNKAISAASALKIVAYHKQVVQTIDALPSGWKDVAIKGLDQLQKDLSPAEAAQIAPFVTLLKTLYGGV